jgi:hypothetical protein
MTGNTSSSHVRPLAVQSWQLAPSEPHSFETVPAWHAPVTSQQPWQASEHGQVPPPVGPSVVWQVPDPSQQPAGHVVGPHAKPAHSPCAQVAAAPHTTQTSPKLPHAPESVPGWHTPLPSQHPFWQESWLQGVGWQTPPRQDDPKQLAHCAPPPPHAFGSLPGWQAPFSSQQPRAQLVASHVESKQVPFSHSALALHRAQAAPKLPH